MNSMTGYGRATIEREGRQLTVELKSVNHRFMDLNFRMPRSFSFLEEDMRKQIGAAIARGHVDIFVTYRNLRDDAKKVAVDKALLTAYQQALDEIAGAVTAKDDRTLMSLARMSDVLVITEQDEDQDALKALMQDTLAEALRALSEMRAREGLSLQGDIITRVEALEGLAAQIAERYPATIAEYTERLKARILELANMNIDEQRMMQEVAIMADKSAISEELVRLQSHFQQLREIIAQQDAAGRKLDFVVQELNREVNTISSKSQDIPITQMVVSAKAEIEKMREQVQNIE